MQAPRQSSNHQSSIPDAMLDHSVAPTSPIASLVPTQPSWQRWWRQIVFIPFLRNRWLTAECRDKLSKAITEAEKGHRGEVFLVVENHLPIHLAHRHNSRDRAMAVFAEYGVWDTADNIGILVYLNVCEQRLEIIADRGINNQVMPLMWQAMCDKALAGIRAGRQADSLCELLADIGKLLRQHYQLEDDPQGNELSDAMVYLR